MSDPGEKAVTVTLSGDEALVLFDWLARTSGADAPAPFVDDAEQRVLWSMEAVLERSLTAILHPDYETLLNEARKVVREDSGAVRTLTVHAPSVLSTNSESTFDSSPSTTLTGWRTWCPTLAWSSSGSTRSFLERGRGRPGDDAHVNFE